jgi:hypothetical protein
MMNAFIDACRNGGQQSSLRGLISRGGQGAWTGGCFSHIGFPHIGTVFEPRFWPSG